MKFEDLTKKYSEYHDKVEGCFFKICDLESELSSIDKKIENFDRLSFSHDENALDLLKQQKENVTKQISDLYSDLQKYVEFINELIDICDDNIVGFDAEKEQHSKEIERQRQYNEEQLSNIKSFEQELDSLNSELVSLNDLEKNVGGLSLKNMDRKKEINTRIKELKSKISDTKGLIGISPSSDVLDSINEQTNNIDNLKKKFDNLRYTINNNVLNHVVDSKMSQENVSSYDLLKDTAIVHSDMVVSNQVDDLSSLINEQEQKRNDIIADKVSDGLLNDEEHNIDSQFIDSESVFELYSGICSLFRKVNDARFDNYSSLRKNLLLLKENVEKYTVDDLFMTSDKFIYYKRIFENCQRLYKQYAGQDSNKKNVDSNANEKMVDIDKEFNDLYNMTLQLYDVVDVEKSSDYVDLKERLFNLLRNFRIIIAKNSKNEQSVTMDQFYELQKEFEDCNGLYTLYKAFDISEKENVVEDLNVKNDESSIKDDIEADSITAEELKNEKTSEKIEKKVKRKVSSDKINENTRKGLNFLSSFFLSKEVDEKGNFVRDSFDEKIIGMINKPRKFFFPKDEDYYTSDEIKFINERTSNSYSEKDGLKKKQNLSYIECPNCGFKNVSDAAMCKNCKNILNEIVIEEQNIDEEQNSNRKVR